MDKITDAAKNLLEGKMCETCKYCLHETSISNSKSELKCGFNFNSKKLPKHNTCEHWEKTRNRLNINWSRQNEKTFKSFSSIDIEKELIKAVNEELTKNMDKLVIEHTKMMLNKVNKNE